MNYKYIFVYRGGEFNDKEFGVESNTPLTQNDKVKIKESILNKTWPNFKINTVTKIIESEKI